MNDIEKLFFELIRVAIGNAVCLSHTPTAAEWNELYAMAKKQSLVGICFAGVQRLQGQQQSPPEMLYLQWLGMAAKIQQRNEVLNRQCKDIYDTLADDCINCCIIKGQYTASLYGTLKNLRQGGDIDLFADANSNTLIEYVAKKKGNVPELSYKHVHLDIFSDTEVDLHYRIGLSRNLSQNMAIQRWADHLKSKGFKYNPKLGYKTLLVEDSIVFTILHIYEHLMAFGVGMRQLMDLYYAISYIQYDENIRNTIVKDLEDLHLITVTGALMWVLVNVFAMPVEHAIVAPNKKEGAFLLEEILQAGNFGRYDTRHELYKDNGFVSNTIKKSMHYLRLTRHYPTEVFWIPFGITYFRLWKIFELRKLRHHV